MVYCTLFYSNYLDKAMAMVDSLFAQDSNAKMYILCMDDKAQSILADVYKEKVILISLNEFEDESLKGIKDSRSKGEYCWTCTAKLIQYVIIKYHEEMCTYVDSDLFFYSDPSVLIDEMKKNNCTVQVIRHNFPNTISGRKLEKDSGKICVQFNTFCNETRSMNLLQTWINSCIEKCSVESAGDQLYLNNWGEYDFVNVSTNDGAGVAPWNVQKFRGLKENNEFHIIDKKTKRKSKLVFYHFQNVVNNERFSVAIVPLLTYWKIDKKFIYSIYLPYLKQLESYKCMIEEKYNYLPIVLEYITDINPKRGYFKRVMRHPIKSIPLIAHRFSLFVLGKVRRKKAYIDIRNIKETNYENNGK